MKSLRDMLVLKLWKNIEDQFAVGYDEQKEEMKTKIKNMMEGTLSEPVKQKLLRYYFGVRWE